MKSTIPLLLALILVAGASASDHPPQPTGAPWLGPEGEELPFESDAEVLEFLRAADVVSSKPLDKGINRSMKLVLEKDGVRAHAVFRTVDARVRAPENLHRTIPSTLRDYSLYECAAYELSRLLGMRSVPPVVERRIAGRRGSLQLWIEQAIDEETRRRRRSVPIDIRPWSRQMAAMRLFDVLIHNWDRNLGNILFDSRGRVWLIDHTQTFGTDQRLLGLERVKSYDPELVARLESLDRALLEETLSPYLHSKEITALLVRRDRLVEYLKDSLPAIH